jgi:hypothetical protein
MERQFGPLQTPVVRPPSSQMGVIPPIDPVKLAEWLNEADKIQCQWMVKYLWNQASREPFTINTTSWTLEQLKQLIEWMLCGEGVRFSYDVLAIDIFNIRISAKMYFAKARNTWNQRVNRKRKVEQAGNTVVVDSPTKLKIQKLAAEHGMREDEFLSILIDLMSERRSAVEGVLRQRKAAKRAAIASDFGFFGVPNTDPYKTSI